MEFDELVLQKKTEETLRIEREDHLLEEKLNADVLKKSLNGITSSSTSSDEEKLDSDNSSIMPRSSKKKSKGVITDDQESYSSSFSDDEPIYKLRKRRQINVTYRYDNLNISILFYLFIC